MKLTVMDILTSSGKYPDREKDPTCNEGVRRNATLLAEKVTAFMADLGFKHYSVSSGFRTPKANSAVPGAALKSNHMTGMAVDISDPTRAIAFKAFANQDLLAKHCLYMEHPDSSLTWCHLQSVAPKSGRRIFKP